MNMQSKMKASRNNSKILYVLRSERWLDVNFQEKHNKKESKQKKNQS